MSTSGAELHSLRIDRSAKRPTPSTPIARIVIIILLLVLVSAAAFFVYGKLTAAVPVHTVVVQSPMTSDNSGNEVVLTATGYIVAAHKIEVASKVVGRVEWIGVEKGDKVKAGQIIVRLEQDEYQAQMRQQQGQLANLKAHLVELQNGSRPEEIAKARADEAEAKADVADAKATVDRTKQLSAEGIVSKQSYDDAQAKYDSAVAKANSLERTLDLAILGPRKEEIQQIEGQIEQAQGGLDYARTQLENTVIRAPVTGTILDRNVERGEFVTNGFVGDKGAKGYLVTMADLNDLQVELDINQADFPKLGPKQKGVVTTDSYPDRKYQGFIEQVSPEGDRAKATVQVKVRIISPDGYLRPDMNATVSFYNEAKAANESAPVKQVVAIPPAALKNGAVFVVLNERAHKRTVTTAGTSEKGVLIDSGLVGGEQLIVSPPDDLKDGQRVQVTQ